MTVESEFGMLKLNLFGVHTRPKIHGVRANNIAASRDVLAITDKISKEVSGIFTVLQLLTIITSSKAFEIALVSTPRY